MIEQFYLTLRGTTNLGQSGPGSNSSEEVLYIPQSFGIGASALDAVVWYTKETRWCGRDHKTS